MSDISNRDDIIDSRDVIARIEELEQEREEWLCDDDGNRTARDESDYRIANPEEAEELKALQELAEEAEGYAADWHHGETLIRDSYFTEYAKELAEDCGMIPSKRSWPMNCIDWEAAAEELRGDYTSVDFDGVEYWVR